MSRSIRSVCQKFLAWCKVALAPQTHDAYAHQLKKFMRVVKNKSVRRARPLDLSTWAKTWHEAQAVVRAFNWAVNEAKILRTNPYSACRLPVRGQRRRILNTAAMQSLLRATRPAPRLFLLALRETLARPQEVRGATWEQLQAENPDTPIERALLDGSALIVQPTFKDHARRKDQTRPRVLLVSRRLGRAILRRRRDTSTPSGPIFVNTYGRPWTKNAVRCLLRRLRRRLGFVTDQAGENVVAYTFRHSLATLASANGVTDRTLADLLGHVETRTTHRYQHLQVAHLRAALQRFTSDRCTGRKAPIRTL